MEIKVSLDCPAWGGREAHSVYIVLDRNSAVPQSPVTSPSHEPIEGGRGQVFTALNLAPWRNSSHGQQEELGGGHG
jgi:hypothetical protein